MSVTGRRQACDRWHLVFGRAGGCWRRRRLGRRGLPLEPFQPDEHTLLLYHFDEGQGTVAKDSSGHGYDGEIRGAEWVEGRFGKALRFDGAADCVFRKATPAIEGLRAAHRRVLVQAGQPGGPAVPPRQGRGLPFRSERRAGHARSRSTTGRRACPTPRGGGTSRSATGLGAVRFGTWHHLAATFDGRQVSFFLDGVLKGRMPGGEGLPVGRRVARAVGRLLRGPGLLVQRPDRRGPRLRLRALRSREPAPGRTEGLRHSRQAGRCQGRAQAAHDRRRPAQPDAQAVSTAASAAGWVSLKPPGKPAAIVGRYDLGSVGRRGRNAAGAATSPTSGAATARTSSAWRKTARGATSP